MLTHTVQMLGENVVGTVLEMGKRIREQGSQPLPAGDAEGSVFLDILGAKMVCTGRPSANGPYAPDLRDCAFVGLSGQRFRFGRPLYIEQRLPALHFHRCVSLGTHLTRIRDSASFRSIITTRRNHCNSLSCDPCDLMTGTDVGASAVSFLQ